MTVITHLSSAKSVEKVSGAKEIQTNQEEDLKTTMVFSDQNQNHGEPTPNLNEVAAKYVECVNDTIQIKEEPPDTHPIAQTRGKLLNPYTFQWTNLPYLCAGKKVLRAKLLEEGGDDVRMEADVPADALLDGLPDGLPDRLADGHAEGSADVLFVVDQCGLIKEGCHFLPLCASQSHIWKPGDHLDCSRLVPHAIWCTSPHEIKRINNLPYMEPIEFKPQRLFPFYCCCVLEAYSVHLDIPRHHNFAPKLSRLKTHHNLPYLDRFHQLSATALFSFNFAIFVSYFRFLER